MPASAPLCGGAFLPEREATLMDQRQILNNRKQSCLNLSLSVEQDSIKCSLLNASSINHKGSPDATTKSCSDASRLNQPIKNCPSERCLASATPNNISTAAAPADLHLYPSCPDSVQCDNDIFERLMSANVSETPAHAATIQCPHDGHTSACFHRCRESKTYIALTLYIVLALLNGCASASKDFYFPDSTQGNFAQDLTHFHVSWPSRVDHHGNFLTYHLHSKADTSSRHRRSVSTLDTIQNDHSSVPYPTVPLLSATASKIGSYQSPESNSFDKSEDHESSSESGLLQEVLHYKIPLHPEKDVVVELQHTRLLLGPSAVVERKVSRFNNISDSLFSKLGHHHGCHLSGVVRGDSSSKAALSACDGLRGFIQIDGVEYLIEPVKGHNKTEDGSHPHLVYRRSALPDHLDFTSRQKRAEPSCGIKEEYTRVFSRRERWERHKRSSSSGRSHDHGSTAESLHSRKRRSISIEKHVETLIVVDPEMVHFYVNEDIETYVLTVMNMVATLFHDASIGNAVNIVIVRILLLQDPDEDLQITHHADNTLRSFCKWQKRINFRDDDHPNHHDVAILLTRRNICSRMNAPCSTLGLAQVAGLCQPHRTCNINEDTGLSLAWTVAHELGHNFGMKHDAPAECHHEPNTQYVMAPHLTWDRTPTSWSTCSRTSITEFLDRNWGYCLDDPPGQHDFKYPTLPAGTMYDADHQCRLLYGEGAESCRGIEVLENICVTLWCRVNNKCSTKLQAAAVGTLCGTNKWCFNGQCVDIGERPQAIDGEWGQWGEWSTCTRTCGAGVSIAQRHCNHPPPSSGGKYCTGERKRYRICNTEQCDENSKSFRAVQCEEFNQLPYKGNKYQWEPILTPDTPCQLHCKPKNMYFSVLLKDIVTDGTPCMVGSRHMCISGRCRHIGCDWILDSSATEDRCGVCFGDGSTCTTIKNRFNETKGLGYVEATVIPKGARNIRVEEVAEASNFLALRNDAGEYYLNGHWFIQWSGDYEMAGTVIHYKRVGNKEKFLAPGPLKEPLHIMLLIQTHNPGVEFEYTVPKENVSDIREPEFDWDYTTWSHCTVSCGGGTQRQAIVCKEKEAGPVHDSYCNKSTKPDDQLRACNVHLCPARWWAGPWQHCTVSCGDQGIHRRTVICVRSLGQDEQIALEDKICEGLEKPQEVAPCRHKDPCPGLGNWELMEWSNCTRSCNGGVQFRKVTCVGGTRCPAPKPDVERACNENECPEAPEHVYFLSEGGKDGVEEDLGDLLVSDSTDSILKTGDIKGPPYPNVGDKDGNVLLGGDPASIGSDFDISTRDPKKPQRHPLPSTHHLNSDENDQETTSWTTKLYSVTEGGHEKDDEDESDDNLTTISTTQWKQDGARHIWLALQWGECSRECGKGTKTREVHCVQEYTGIKVDVGKCDLTTKPSTVLECALSSCLEWETKEWSQCSATCGQGIQTREVLCPTHGHCNAAVKPEITKECDSLPTCTAWVHGDWSKCTKTCGGGRQERLVQCVNLTSQQLTQGCDRSVMPEGGRPCNKQDCPKDVGAALSQSCESNEMSFKVCRMLKRIGLCHKQYVKSKCCRTCTDHKRPKPDIKKLS